MEKLSRWDGMRDGDEESVETPFGEVTFQYERGDSSVGIPSGVFATRLRVGVFTFDREALETCKAGPVTLADALETWAGNE